jgi:hypothetical protein
VAVRTWESRQAGIGCLVPVYDRVMLLTIRVHK